MTVEDVIRDYIAEHGFDGLFNDELECACGGEEELIPCDDRIDECIFGYNQPCTCGGGHDFHIGLEKED